MDNKKTKVYFSKNYDKIINQLDFSRFGQKVAIKVHFGEPGCVTFLKPEFARKLYEKITALGKKVTLIECNVLYKGRRTNAKDHIETAHQHGFDMPIDILDGEQGQDMIEINDCKIGKGIKKYDSLVVLTHFKGHMHSGFGGSIKNVGMGLGSRAGKLDMHSKIRPSINQEKCVGCGVCIQNCNAEAIFFSEDKKAEIDQVKCEGCAMCISVCEERAIMVPWHGGTAERLQQKMAEYAKATLSKFGQAFFINVLHNITEECDCMGKPQKPVMEDVGVVASENIVAIDRASLDLANKYSSGAFGKINSVDKAHQLKVAQEAGLGSGEYELEDID